MMIVLRFFIFLFVIKDALGFKYVEKNIFNNKEIWNIVCDDYWESIEILRPIEGLLSKCHSWSEESEQYRFSSEETFLVNRANTQTDSQCPPGQSMFSKNDVITMINYLESKLNITNTINKAYYPKAVALREKHVENLKTIQSRLENRPRHFQHILEDIDAIRLKLEPIVQQSVIKLQQYPFYEAKFNDLLESIEKSFEELNKYKLLCQFNNCNESQLPTRQNNDRVLKVVTKKLSDENYYCASIQELHERITSNLTKFHHEYLDELFANMNRDNQKYEQKILGIQTKVKDSAISMFGTTMYETISLQEEYHYFAEAFNNNTIDSMFNSITRNDLEVEYKLMELTDDVEKYHQYCLNCNNAVKTRFTNILKKKPKDLLIFLTKTTGVVEKTEAATEATTPNPEIKSFDADKLIQTKIDEIRGKISNDYKNIFMELDKQLDDPELVDSFVAKLKPIHEIVESELKTRQGELFNLKSKVPQETVVKVNKLTLKTEELLERVKNAIDFMHKHVH